MPDRRPYREARLLAYCLASGAAAVGAATVAASAATGTSRLVAWLSVFATVAVTTGLAYECGPLAWRRLARVRRKHG